MLVGQVLLLAALVGSVYGAFAVLVGGACGHRGLARTGHWAATASVAALTAVTGLLAYALVVKDFHVAYVAEYSSRLLPWHYSLSALWVGQAGSLLLWAWFMGVVALGFRYWPDRQASRLREPAFGVLTAYLGFLVAIMVFAADPMQPSLAPPPDGAGLSPLLQHPAMLLHPPVVFLGYAVWAVPFAAAIAALMAGDTGADWVRQSRGWTLAAWAALGVGILLGAQWAYEELGWGGYWAWDPVENGSLIPWLTGTALIHAMLSWQHRGVWKKSALLLSVATFALCNFASFLTRSGIFSSLHAFSQSPIGWMFLGLMVFLAAVGVTLVVLRRGGLGGEHRIRGLWTREALVLVANVALLLLATVALVGTLAAPLSKVFSEHKITVGIEFYNNVLVPTGLVLLGTVALAPLLRWGKNPTLIQRVAIGAALTAGLLAAAVAFPCGVRHPIALAVAAWTAAALVASLASLVLDGWRQAGTLRPAALVRGVAAAVAAQRRQYAGFVLHLALVSLAVGVAGSSLGTRYHDTTLALGESVEWMGHQVRFVRRIDRPQPDKTVVEAQLDVTPPGGRPYSLFPAQHWHPQQQQWTTEVAIHSTWAADFYAVAHSGEGDDRVSLSFVYNPLMRWLWLSGFLAVAGTCLALWPTRRRLAASAVQSETQPSVRRRAA